MTVTSPPTRVLYIGGMGRSGSTLLELLLAQVPGVVSVGELRYAWERGPIDDVLCSCGQPFHACPFWKDVGDRAFDGWHRLDARAVLNLQRSVDRHRYLPALLGGRPRGFIGRYERYAGLLGRLYRAIAACAGATVVVDSTKDPPHAFLLRRSAEIDLRLVHLIRDSRGVAFSWSKTVARPEVVSEAANMDRVPSAVMALKWLDYNMLFDILRRLGTPTCRVRYEDLVAEPSRVLAGVLTMAGIDSRSADGIVDVPSPAGMTHSLSGNPLRFRRGPLQLALDDEWRRSMPAGDRRLVSVLTWPMLRAYGYPRAAEARSRG